MTNRLVEPPWRFDGFRTEDFSVFAIPDRESRRLAILDRFHPALKVMGEDLLEHLDPDGNRRLHAHLPRLDWPKGYQPFCTWLAISSLAHGYQAGPQLNVGIHAEHVSARLAWDTSADAFGRFEFQCRFGGLGEALRRLADESGLSFRVYSGVPWPEGSRVVFTSVTDWEGSLDEVHRRGNWWELGRRWDLQSESRVIQSRDLVRETAAVFSALTPAFDRAA